MVGMVVLECWAELYVAIAVSMVKQAARGTTGCNIVITTLIEGRKIKKSQSVPEFVQSQCLQYNV
jgi:hypothetical protein